MEYMEINLYDAESQEQYNIKVSQEDAIKAQNGKLKVMFNIFIIIEKI